MVTVPFSVPQSYDFVAVPFTASKGLITTVQGSNSRVLELVLLSLKYLKDNSPRTGCRYSIPSHQQMIQRETKSSHRKAMRTKLCLVNKLGVNQIKDTQSALGVTHCGYFRPHQHSPSMARSVSQTLLLTFRLSTHCPIRYNGCLRATTEKRCPTDLHSPSLRALIGIRQSAGYLINRISPKIIQSSCKSLILPPYYGALSDLCVRVVYSAVIPLSLMCTTLYHVETCVHANHPKFQMSRLYILQERIFSSKILVSVTLVFKPAR